MHEVRYRDHKGRSKRVRYWAMEPVAGEFQPNGEVDAVRWVAVDRVARLVTYGRDAWRSQPSSSGSLWSADRVDRPGCSCGLDARMGFDGWGNRGCVSSDERPVLLPSEVSQRVGFFDRFAGWAALISSRAYFFAFCVLLIIVWAPSYVLIGNIDTWQLIINTATTIITFLLVALLQNSQTRSDQAVQHKLNAIARRCWPT